jgi:uncharacterized protein
MTDQICLSKFVFPYFVGEKVILYHSLLIKKIALENYEWENLQKNIDEKTGRIDTKQIQYDILNSLVENGFATLDSNEDSGVLESAQMAIKKNLQPQTLFLVTTEKCNLACDYCYSMPHRNNMMNDQIMQKAILAFANASKNVKMRNIFFTGGEPLINYELIHNALKYLQVLNNQDILKSPYGTAISTNGILINDRIAKEAVDFGMFYAVSLDGLPQHNVLRPYKSPNDKNSYYETKEGIKKLKDAGADFSIVATVHKYNVEQLDRIAEHFITDLGAKSIGFTLLIYRHDDYLRYSVDLETVANNVIKAFRICQKYGVDEARMAVQLESFTQEKLNLYDCKDVPIELVVTPDGLVGPNLYFLGNKLMFKKESMDDLTFINDSYFQDFSYSSSLFNKTCQSCPALGICGGGNHFNRYKLTGSIDGIYPEFCNYMLTILKFLISEAATTVIEK